MKMLIPIDVDEFDTVMDELEKLTERRVSRDEAVEVLEMVFRQLMKGGPYTSSETFWAVLREMFEGKEFSGILRERKRNPHQALSRRRR